MRHRRKELPSHPRVRELLDKDSAGTLTGEEAQELLKLQFRGQQKSAQMRHEAAHAKKTDASPAPAVPDSVGRVKTAEEHQAEFKKAIVQRRLAEEYKVDHRRDILDENGDVIPNPRYGERLDS